MKNVCCVLACFVGLTAISARAQGPNQPFGVDIENLDVSKCNPNVGCPELDEAAKAGAQWVRLLAIWWFLEPQQNQFNWGILPWQVWYAQNKGMQVYFTMVWPPQWANGATSTQPPYAGHGSCGDCGRTVLDSNYTYGFFYNLAAQFNGSTTAGCAADDWNTCHPLVQYFGVLNEPNNSNNYLDTYYDPNNSGNYLVDFVSQYLFPAYNGVKQANPSAYVVLPELQQGSSSCGGFFSCDYLDSWLQPLMQYFSSSFDIISVHDHESNHTNTRDEVDSIFARVGYSKPVWVTECDFSSTDATNVTNVYVDQHNRYLGPSSGWTKLFFNMGGYTPCGSADDKGLTCSYDGVTLTEKSQFGAYFNAYYPH